SAVVRGHARPFRPCRSRNADGITQVLARCARDVRALGLVGAPRLGAREGSTDVELVGLLYRQPLGHASSRTTYGSRPCRPPSRPKPDSLYPPNGEAGSKRLYVFAHTTPARSFWAMARMRDPFSVQTPADSPYGVLFAFSIASSGVRKVSTESTGPKISSWAMRWAWDTPVNRVGANQYPRSGSTHGGDHRSAPSSSPAAESSRMRSSWAAELIAPTSVFLSSGSPTRSCAIRSRSRASTLSTMDSCTSRREPA